MEYKRLFCGAILTLACSFACAQNNSAQESKGERKGYNEKVVVTAPYQPTLGSMSRSPFQPQPSDSNIQVGEMDYQIVSRPLATSYPIENIKAVKVLGEPIKKLRNNSIRIGIGYPLTPLAEVNFGVGRSRKYDFSAFYRHHSTFGPNIREKSLGYIKGYDRYKSNTSINEAAVRGGIFTDKFIVNLDILYSQKLVNCYGLSNEAYADSAVRSTVDLDIYEEMSKRWFQNARGIVTFQDNARKAEDIRFTALLDYNLNLSNSRSQEGTLIAAGNVSKQIMDTRKGLDVLCVGGMLRFEDNTFRDGVKDGYWDYGSTTSEATYHRGNEMLNAYHLQFAPTVHYTYKMVELDGALVFHVFGNQASKSPKVEKQDKFQFNPLVDLKLHLIDKILVLEAGTGGGVHRNTEDLISQTNPYLHALYFDDFKFTRDKFSAYVGLFGNFSSHIDFRIKASAHLMEDMLSFDYYRYNWKYLVNYYGYNDFVPIYTGKVFDMKVRGELNFRWDERILAHIDATYDYYDKTVYYHPAFKANVGIRYNLAKNRLSLYTNLMIMTGMKALDRYGKEVTLNQKGVYDWSLGAEYRFIDRMTAFINLNNIAAQKYYIWNDYQAYRFNFVAGLTVDF